MPAGGNEKPRSDWIGSDWVIGSITREHNYRMH
uniref:Uncharacterized protein n=1 Tax=Physcomitrium patens TaxID=3218 RepID=A0A2K1KJ18_PHYPA|nr:hypothetical protein PHYPA_007446 [Physcomitrium patens]